MLKISGIKETRQTLKKIQESMVNEAKNKALADMGFKIGELSSKLVGVEFGILKSSFVVQKNLAGYNTEYAAYQHQGVRKDGTHVIRNRPGGGQSFFLSEPVKRNKTQLLNFFNERFAHHIKKL